MSSVRYVILLAVLWSGVSLFSAEKESLTPQNTDKPVMEQNIDGIEVSGMRLKYKIVPLNNPVYQLLDYLEAEGKIGLLPQAKPYTRIYIAQLLADLLRDAQCHESEKKQLVQYLKDLTVDTNGIKFYKDSGKNSFAVAGFSADTYVRSGIGKHGAPGTSLTGEPYLSGDLGDHFSFNAAIGLSIEKLTPDIFYQSYTKGGQVVFPYEQIGYSFLPYQFNFDTMWAHVLTEGTSGEGKPVRSKLTAGMIYHTELAGSWFNGALQLGIHNQRRAWGYDQNNLVLSSTARRFPAVEMKLQPTKWIRYSYLLGSLFSYANQDSMYRHAIYGYDLGEVQKNFTYHLLEFMPSKWLQFSAGGGNIWSKRFELAYMVPFVMPHFTQIEVGDNDNLTMYFDAAGLVPHLGKVWASFFVDEFNFTHKGNLLKMPGNRYAWQLGWRTNLLSGILPATSSTLKYTRLTPFVYTHYPEKQFNSFSTGRALDMTYSHDEFNLGFYLPPNSAELNWNLVNRRIPDLVLSLDNRLIVHGTNDLKNTNPYQITGDIYRYQMGSDALKYPELDFGRDGIYDWTLSSEIKFDWKLRYSKLLNYYRLVGSLGYAHTSWKSNLSGVTTPAPQKLLTASIGIVVEM